MELKVATPDAQIADLAGRQHRIVSRPQLLAAGFSLGAIRHRVEAGRLFERYPGVYCVGVRDPGPHGHLIAAVLACGRGAVLSHRSAAVLFRLLAARTGPVDVLVPGRRGARGRPGLALRTTRSLPRTERTTRLRIPCTTVERTLVDLAATHPGELERAVEQAFVLKLLGPTRMAEALGNASGRRGTRTLRRLLAGLLPQLPFTRSELERLFLKLIAGNGLPEPIVNRHAEAHRVDFHWPAHNLIVETDGRGSHDNPYAFERDRERDLDLELAGIHVIRLTWRQITEQPDRVVALLRARLAAA